MNAGLMSYQRIGVAVKNGWKCILDLCSNKISIYLQLGMECKSFFYSFRTEKDSLVCGVHRPGHSGIIDLSSFKC